MGPFRWLEDPGQLESLALCLRSLTALAGAPADYDELVVELGLGSLIVADARRPLADWQNLARNELLVVTAERFGVRLRDLHPRRAAIGLETSAEYPLHFLDSYVPLIERALSSAQLVLAWRGWPAPRDGSWGVITEIRDGAIRGYTLDHSAEPLSLLSPAHQVYVVEEVASASDARLDAADAFAHAAWAFRAQEAGAWCSDRGLQTGSYAWSEWAARLGLEGTDRATVRAHRDSAMQVTAARESLHRWLRTSERSLPPALRESAKQWAESCAETARRLRATADPSDSHLANSTIWYSATIESLTTIAELDRAAVTIVAPHARPVAVQSAYEPHPLEI